MSTLNLDELLARLPAEIKTIVWDYTAFYAVKDILPQLDLKFLHDVQQDGSCWGSDAYYIYANFLGEIKTRWENVWPLLFGYHRLEVLEMLRARVEKIEHDADYVEKYILKYPGETFEEHEVVEIKKWVDRDLSLDIGREKIWRARVKQCAGVMEAIPRSAVDEKFLRKIVWRKEAFEKIKDGSKDIVDDTKHDAIWSREGNYFQEFGYWEAFQRVVNQKYGGGGLLGGNRVACLRAWKRAVAGIEVTDTRKKDGSFGPPRRLLAARDEITNCCRIAMNEEWRKQQGLKQSLDYSFKIGWPTTILMGYHAVVSGIDTEY